MIRTIAASMTCLRSTGASISGGKTGGVAKLCSIETSVRRFLKRSEYLISFIWKFHVYRERFAPLRSSCLRQSCRFGFLLATFSAILVEGAITRRLGVLFLDEAHCHLDLLVCELVVHLLQNFKTQDNAGAAAPIRMHIARSPFLQDDRHYRHGGSFFPRQK